MIGDILAPDQRCKECNRRGPVIIETSEELRPRDIRHIKKTWSRFALKFAMPEDVLIFHAGIALRTPDLQERFRWGVVIGICVGLLVGAALGFATGALV